MKVNHVAKARKAAGKCFRCEKPIKKGDAYKWIKGRFGPRKVYCDAHSPKASEMTGSDKLAQLYAAQEAVQEVYAAGLQKDFVEALTDAAETARSVGEEYRDAIENMPENFQQGTKADELNDSAYSCESWADQLESARDEIEAMDAWDTDGFAIGDETPEPKEGEEDKRENLREQAENTADQAVGSLEL